MVWPPSLRIDSTVARGQGLIRGLPQPPPDLGDAEVQAWTDLVEGIASDPRVNWLSSLSALRFADNKINQLRIAVKCGVPCPKTLIPAKASDIAAGLGEEAVVKPLGPGILHAGDSGTRVFYTTKMRVRELDDKLLARAPVIAQEPIDADLHLRVVTVQDRIWCAGLDARGLPLDWREASPKLRRAWHEMDVPADVREGALALVRSADLGFSSQDWLVEGDRRVFIDLNPNGGWLFLPSSVSNAVNGALVEFLLGAT